MAHGLAACSSGGLSASSDGVYAPGVDTRKEAVDGVEVGHRLIAAGEFELAIKAFTRAALDDGMNAEILSGLGTANLGLGRLGQAEKLLRRATTDYEAWPEIYNNLGVVLMESGQNAEAEQIFRKAYALDDGESTLIRDNLRLALAKTEKSVNVEEENNNYKLVRRGSSDYLIRPAS
ncbi:tetratricopeptide repeat protein [Pseudosulfitobacter koreensis]|uniref:Tetratricopeptide repeat protein n=1 Tax=Pseudosulfitobacter koreensis TaxID=2968472 RepID=A0ABT1Z357_9RHOB|nr:tetratricopeptide repeat protein [Pseudosulfitobacter koreense]MCR8827566.1 tetratricopeptide repeat protein [Pseudosulfitobacter koreense]